MGLNPEPSARKCSFGRSTCGIGPPPAKKTKRAAHNYAKSSTITVLVGPNEVKFRIHEDLLFYANHTIKIRCSSTDVDGDTRYKLVLPRASVDAFDVIVSHLYPNPKTLSPTPADMEDAIRAWILADDLGMECTKNGIMDTIRAEILAAEMVTPSTVDLNKVDQDILLVCKAVSVFQTSIIGRDTSSTMYRFLRDRLAYGSAKISIKKLLRKSSTQELLGLIRAGGDIVAFALMNHLLEDDNDGSINLNVSPAANGGCHYHEHKHKLMLLESCTPVTHHRSISSAQNAPIATSVIQ